MGILSREPALIIGFVLTALALAGQFGVAISNDQRLAIKDFLEALLPLLAGILIRPNVASARTLRDAGTSLEEVDELSQIHDVNLRPQAEPGISSPEARAFMSKNGSGSTSLIVMLAIGLSTLASFGCANRGANVTPHVAVAEYGAEVLKVTAAFQDVVIAYAKAQGGNATTDAIMKGIDTNVTPAAKELSALLKSYDAIRDPALKETRYQQIEAQLSTLLSAYATVTGNIEIAQLATEAQVTASRIRELVAQVRLALAKARADNAAPLQQHRLRQVPA